MTVRLRTASSVRALICRLTWKRLATYCVGSSCSVVKLMDYRSVNGNSARWEEEEEGLWVPPATSLGLGAQEWPRPLKTGVAVPARGPSALIGRPRKPGFRVQPAYRIITEYGLCTEYTGEVLRDGPGGMVRRFCAVGSVLSGRDR